METPHETSSAIKPNEARQTFAHLNRASEKNSHKLHFKIAMVRPHSRYRSSHPYKSMEYGVVVAKTSVEPTSIRNHQELLLNPLPSRTSSITNPRHFESLDSRKDEKRKVNFTP